MESNFRKSLELVLGHEGTYSNDPRDKGGETMRGVTRAVWEEWVKRPCRPGEMRTLTNDDVAPLYEKNYWGAMSCDDLPAGVDYAAFDFAVNAGPRQCKKILQRALGVHDDGVIGPMTLAAIKQADGAQLLHRFSEEKEKFYRSLTKDFATFGKGWLNRVRDVEANAKGMM
jgi:lysozyme family protein